MKYTYVVANDMVVLIKQVNKLAESGWNVISHTAETKFYTVILGKKL